MKLMKKLISAVCTMALCFSTVSALVVNADNDVEAKPTLKLEQLSYDESTKTGRAKISLQGIDKTATTLDNMFVMSYQVAVLLPSTSFDVDLYKTTGRPKPISQNVTISDRLSSKITGPNFVEATGLAATYADNSTDTALNSYAEGTNDDMSNIPFMEFNFTLKDGVDSVQPSFGDVMIVTREYDDDLTSVQTENKWGNIGTIKAMNYDIATLGKEATDPEPETPKYDTVTKLDTFSDGDNDHAVAFVKTFAATESGKLYNMFAKFGGVEMKYKNTITLPTVADGRIGVGVVIQYDDSEVTVSDLRFEEVTE